MLVLSCASAYGIGDNTTNVTLEQCHQDYMKGLTLGVMIVMSNSTKTMDPQVIPKLQQYSIGVCEYYKEQLGHYDLLTLFSGFNQSSEAQMEMQKLNETKIAAGINMTAEMEEYLKTHGYGMSLPELFQ